VTGSRSSSRRPEGRATRGTTAPNRLRRIDRWLADQLRGAAGPLVVDLGFGAAPWTTVELASRLPRATVVGLEIDADRVAAAEALADPPRLTFHPGGFELGGLRPDVVRAMNVLRQYDEHEVPAVWRRLAAALAPGGFVVDGTCDELGRVATWLRIDADARPSTLTLSARMASLDRPSTFAPRLPKALIHRNVGGEAVHALLADLDRAWERAAPYTAFGPRQRWFATVARIRDEDGWPVVGGRSRWRLGEVTVTVRSCSPTGSWPW
jgi:hypothetical protein